MIELPDIKELHVEIDKIENKHTLEKNISLSILRLDKFHPKIQGNKFFKLYYFLENAITAQKNIITFGGAYSNHLAATARACKIFGIKCIGIVRGEAAKALSHTLEFCKEQGMQLEFISREDYNRKDDDDFQKELIYKLGDHILIPEGGFSKEGTDGAALISNFYSSGGFTHICCAVGTATTLAGLISSSLPSQQLIGFSAIKNLDDFEKRIQLLLGTLPNKNYSLNNDYHFGGYAKKTEELITFMNAFYDAYQIPTDFVYTAKMMFGVLDLIKKNHFTTGSKILCIHTGGLQGNISLPRAVLNF
jgi:1-aminocyclopropane-1-carboxylate deaminase/D-cysteine desulfhydrase-like pyridoxal-dependent ACC family enzyme